MTNEHKDLPVAYAIHGINGRGEYFIHDVRLAVDKDWTTDDASLGERWAGNEALYTLAARPEPAGAGVKSIDTQEFRHFLQNCYAELGYEGAHGALVTHIDAHVAAQVAKDAPNVPADPMDWPLPCDVTVGAGTIKKGCALRTLVARMKVMNGMIREGWSSAQAAPQAQAQAQAQSICKMCGDTPRIADQRLMLKERFANRGPSPATADFDLPPACIEEPAPTPDASSRDVATDDQLVNDWFTDNNKYIVKADFDAWLERAYRDGLAKGRESPCARDAALEEAAQLLLNGHFLHDQAPPKLFAAEAAKAIRALKSSEGGAA